MSERRPHVVIVGGGFGGLTAAKSLRRADVDVTLVDRSNHHTFQPLLYQVATAGLNASDIAVPIRRILRDQKNVTVLLDEAVRVDVEKRCIELASRTLSYDFLIVATGATHSYFGHDAWAELAPGLKTIEDALEIRRRVYFAFEAAEREDDPKKRVKWLTFVLVGAGPTGVELAGVLAEIAHHTLRGDFRRIDPTKARVVLLEGGPRVLAAYPANLAESAKEQLERLGVEVRCSARVTAIDDRGVSIGDERIEAKTVLWAAGVAASPLAATLGAPLDRAGRVLVAEDLSLPNHPEVFVVGDLASVTQDGAPVPGVAAAANQGGKHAAACIRATIAKKPRDKFRYEDPGALATIGRAAAIAKFGKIELTGFLAWLSWLLIHIFFLIGFRNRFFVLIDWALSYLTYDRGARLITGDPRRFAPRAAEGEAPKSRRAPGPL